MFQVFLHCCFKFPHPLLLSLSSWSQVYTRLIWNIHYISVTTVGFLEACRMPSTSTISFGWWIRFWLAIKGVQLQNSASNMIGTLLINSALTVFHKSLSLDLIMYVTLVSRYTCEGFCQILSTTGRYPPLNTDEIQTNNLQFGNFSPVAKLTQLRKMCTE